jgi:hypothetical protein
MNVLFFEKFFFFKLFDLPLYIGHTLDLTFHINGTLEWQDVLST